MTFSDAIRDGFSLIHRQWQLVAVHAVVTIIYIFSFFILVGIPLLVAFVAFGIDIATITETQNVLVTFMTSELNLAIPSTSEDIISGDKIEFPTEDGQVKVELAMSPEQVRLFAFRHNNR